MSNCCEKCGFKDGFQGATGCSNPSCECHSPQNKEKAAWLTDFRADVKKIGIKKWDKNLFALESLVLWKDYGSSLNGSGTF